MLLLIGISEVPPLVNDVVQFDQILSVQRYGVSELMGLELAHAAERVIGVSALVVIGMCLVHVGESIHPGNEISGGIWANNFIKGVGVGCMNVRM